jgi:hypothetical protein
LDTKEHPSWWRVGLLIFAFGLFAYAGYLIILTYVSDGSSSKQTDSSPIFGILKSDAAPLLSINGRLESTEGYQVNIKIIADLSVNTTLNNRPKEVMAVFVESKYAEYDNLMVTHLLPHVTNQSIFLKPMDVNSTKYVGKDEIRFEEEGEYGILLLAINNENAIVTRTYLPDELSIPTESELAQLQAARQATNDSARIEGLTLVGIGFAIVMFLLEIGITVEEEE